MQDVIDQHKKAFTEIFHNRGPNFDIDLLNKEQILYELFSSIRDGAASILVFLKNVYPNSPFVWVDFITNNAANAACAKYKNKYFIGINTGLYFVLFDMFSKILSSNKTLVHIGNPSIEKKEKSYLNILSGGHDIYDPTNFTTKPLDDDRAEYAVFCRDLAISFVLFHECGHILNGHVGYLEEKHNLNILDENPSKNIIDLLGADFSQTLEMDADSFAVNKFFAIIYQRKKDKIPEKNKYSLRSWEEIIFDYMFVIATYITFVELSSKNVNKTQPSSHPPPQQRIQMISANIVTLFQTKFNGIVDVEIPVVLASLSRARKAAEYAISEVTYHEVDFVRIKEALNKDGLSYFSRITSNWNNVRPKIEKFAFHSFLPPQTN